MMCENCAVWMLDGRPNKRFCSARCRLAAWRRGGVAVEWDWDDDDPDGLDEGPLPAVEEFW